eukprot:CAMPEP_0175735472 /NCGR_PEP_ID=MMETSP0097-20121207/52917_1 /TAXON_ID=311494 /ORGANISM="Alexandrium monilatum, Strain CCMP3105" /LENGTH=507 /DNA_ID=CAMNT_0017043527 /DNA_START=26 /DNA_END=1546 /DNA_ORIENTATION=-
MWGSWTDSQDSGGVGGDAPFPPGPLPVGPVGFKPALGGGSSPGGMMGMGPPMAGDGTFPKGGGAPPSSIVPLPCPAMGGIGGDGQPGSAGGMMSAMNPMMNPMFAAMAAQAQGGGAEGAGGGERPMVPPMAMMMNPMMAAMAARMAQGQGGEGGEEVNPMGMMGPMAMMMMMQCNPMMANFAGMMRAQQGLQKEEPPPKEEPKEEAIDPDVQELGDYYNIEDRWIKRLDETMRKRRDTKEQDLAKLYEVLERARSPTGLLTVKIGEMESGQFVGKVKPDKDVERLARKFKLDERVKSRLTEVAVRLKDSKDMHLERLEQHLTYSKHPNAMATLLAGKLLEHEVDELPDLREAEQVMEKFRLDEDARSKLREIVEKRAADKTEVLNTVRKHLEASSHPSAMLCRIARSLIDGEKLEDPPSGGRRQGPLAAASGTASGDTTTGVTAIAAVTAAANAAVTGAVIAGVTATRSTCATAGGAAGTAGRGTGSAEAAWLWGCGPDRSRACMLP